MITVSVALLIIALVLFLLSALNVTGPINLFSLGAFCVTLYLLLRYF